ncbi:methyltransferase domain-containing protein [Haloferax sp. MBLA0076]|uniref:Methyltransferase domain-containing protein n=1 Tax=Haloferax litoreum TaxID=2666140 RepID=A0A6A8GDK6_9EURY|nr:MULTISPECIES: class I SAM-dependent methyltransferase [Haloferax]KAB1192410.1 class I SAM-dependent methyltransferase [Haloferax sp. CBA1148]MRX20876.1 methyltransferase domain-containing protein [Haloferax litoreum]
MHEVSRTRSVYESESDAFVDKYRAESVAALFGDDFYEALAGDRILDVGCGPGVDTETFVTDGFDVVGFDLTSSFVRAARTAVDEASFARGDMRRLPFRDGSFDGVWSCASFLHVPRPDAPGTLREFRRVLADDGVAYLSVKRGEESGFDTDGRYFELYRPEQVRSLVVDAGFGRVDIETGERWIQVLARV